MDLRNVGGIAVASPRKAMGLDLTRLGGVKVPASIPTTQELGAQSWKDYKQFAPDELVFDEDEAAAVAAEPVIEFPEPEPINYPNLTTGYGGDEFGPDAPPIRELFKDPELRKFYESPTSARYSKQTADNYKSWLAEGDQLQRQRRRGVLLRPRGQGVLAHVLRDHADLGSYVPQGAHR